MNKSLLILLIATLILTGCHAQHRYGYSSAEQKDLDAQLVTAANHSSARRVRELLYRGARIDTSQQSRLQRILFIAVISDDVELARAVVDLGADPKIGPTFRDTTWLFEAAQQGEPEMIRFLYSRGVRDDWAMLIETAASWYHDDAVKTLKQLRDEEQTRKTTK